MTPEAQRSAIALACGHRRTTCPAGEIEWRGPGGQFLGRFAPDSIPDKVPDYLNDLNACHEMEKVFDEPQNAKLHSQYAHYLAVMCYDSGFSFRATAAQRCEAFLKTLNLWTP